jgi:hypothetical protein
MSKRALLAGVLMCLALVSSAYSQSTGDKNRGDFGIYFDYTRLQFADVSLFGIGGRAGINLHPHIALEGEFAYDFSRAVGPACLPPPFTTDCFQPNVRLLHGLFGPKLQTTGPVRVFAVFKGGFINFGVSQSLFTIFSGGSASIQDGETRGALFPGAGVEFSRGRISLRFEAGDEMFFANGANHNFKFMAGPQIRF